MKVRNHSMKKRALSLILALLLAVSLGVPAFASEEAGTETDEDAGLTQFPYEWFDEEVVARIRDLWSSLRAKLTPDLPQDYTRTTYGTAACDLLSVLLAMTPIATLLAVRARQADSTDSAGGAVDPGGTDALRFTQVNYTWLGPDGKTREGTDVYAYANGGTLPSSLTRNSWAPFSFTYDEQGRVLTGEGFTCSYDEDGRLAEKRRTTTASTSISVTRMGVCLVFLGTPASRCRNTRRSARIRTRRTEGAPPLPGRMIIRIIPAPLTIPSHLTTPDA